MKKLFTRKLTRAEANVFCTLVGVIGLLIAVLASRDQTILLSNSAWFWLGTDMAAAGFIGLFASNTSSEEG